MVTHGIEATCVSPNGIEAKCASPRWRPNPEIDWHRDRYPRDMINPAGRNHVIRQRSPSSNAIINANYFGSLPEQNKGNCIDCIGLVSCFSLIGCSNFVTVSEPK